MVSCEQLTVGALGLGVGVSSSIPDRANKLSSQHPHRFRGRERCNHRVTFSKGQAGTSRRSPNNELWERSNRIISVGKFLHQSWQLLCYVGTKLHYSNWRRMARWLKGYVITETDWDWLNGRGAMWLQWLRLTHWPRGYVITVTDWDWLTGRGAMWLQWLRLTHWLRGYMITVTDWDWLTRLLPARHRMRRVPLVSPLVSTNQQALQHRKLNSDALPTKINTGWKSSI